MWNIVIFANPVGGSQTGTGSKFLFTIILQHSLFQNEIDNVGSFIEYFSTLYGIYPFELENTDTAWRRLAVEWNIRQ